MKFLSFLLPVLFLATGAFAIEPPKVPFSSITLGMDPDVATRTLLRAGVTDNHQFKWWDKSKNPVQYTFEGEEFHLDDKDIQGWRPYGDYDDPTADEISFRYVKYEGRIYHIENNIHFPKPMARDALTAAISGELGDISPSCSEDWGIMFLFDKLGNQIQDQSLCEVELYPTIGYFENTADLVSKGIAYAIDAVFEGEDDAITTVYINGLDVNRKDRDSRSLFRDLQQRRSN